MDEHKDEINPLSYETELVDLVTDVRARFAKKINALKTEIEEVKKEIAMEKVGDDDDEYEDDGDEDGIFKDPFNALY